VRITFTTGNAFPGMQQCFRGSCDTAQGENSSYKKDYGTNAGGNCFHGATVGVIELFCQDEIDRYPS
jgi:hypothetical protein